ncbi:type-F conjugative transfer system pilin assembly protein TrbC [Providencia alcalifaciens]|uniref:Type-F conjugative transfer system pilin assembly protein TrbC n=2 Tax=Providencia alcalifaciens TaxID=126385 RepID=A0AAV3M7E0_9GAMM|nr:type-F conjugative transfer system pilin assembly protein TrbC [Providencia alcalifaciens]EBW1331210.1 type-F conjugative transfer system pilin assembly protein TrbC [Salmonella enterica subsp. enterica serovar Enteritidis]EUD04161.1 type-F conjugative transfer system pilin assembly protein TrbC [Providencia alcalifaciens RIMD 1656011]EUD11738.1 type-F conjugative transfer system pilin assembly protein TrbC [Providencia alcalifaciens 205/92]MTC62430.1 type-F conjugative transfer system pilin
MKPLLFLFASVLLAPTCHALTDDQQFLESLRDQSVSALEGASVSPDDQAFFETLRAQPSSVVGSQSEPERPDLPSTSIPAQPSPPAPQVNGIPAENQAWINDILAKQKQSQQQAQNEAQVKAQQDSPFVYFVSFSIPEAALKQMLPEANRLNIPSVINGLIDNDFRKTASTVFELTKDSGDGGVQIDPNVFAQYGITQVPALVLRCEQGVDVLYGNVHLRSAIERMATSGDCQQVAQQWLHAQETP